MLTNIETSSAQTTSTSLSLLVVEDASDLRKLVENLARNVIFVGCGASAGAARALKNTLQSESYTSTLTF